MLGSKGMEKREFDEKMMLLTDLENSTEISLKRKKMNVIKFEVPAGHLFITVLNIQENLQK